MHPHYSIYTKYLSLLRLDASSDEKLSFLLSESSWGGEFDMGVIPLNWNVVRAAAMWGQSFCKMDWHWLVGGGRQKGTQRLLTLSSASPRCGR